MIEKNRAVFWLLVMWSVCGNYGRVKSTDNERQMQNDAKSICSGSECGEYSYKYIRGRFPGIFYTRTQFAVKEKKFSVVREKYLHEQGVHINHDLKGDGDSCCPTRIRAFTNVTMENIDGETKYIVHIPPRYQYIPHGFCVEGGNCDGKCVNEPVTQSLLTYNVATAKLEFDQFVVPGYCSCKAT